MEHKYPPPYFWVLFIFMFLWLIYVRLGLPRRVRKEIYLRPRRVSGGGGLLQEHNSGEYQIKKMQTKTKTIQFCDM